MRRALPIAIVGVVLLLASPAWGAVKISRINFNPPGSDTGSRSSLRAEWIELKNTGSNARNLKDWRVLDEGRDHAYRFRAKFILKPGATVKIRTGPGDDTHSDRFWDLDNYVWNNDGDKAKLRNPAGRTKDLCDYSGSAPSPVGC